MLLKHLVKPAKIIRKMHIQHTGLLGVEYTADTFVKKGYTIYTYLEGSKYTIEIGFHTPTEGAKRQASRFLPDVRQNTLCRTSGKN